MIDDILKDSLIISLDYELFFGSNTGTVSRCLVEPTAALLTVLDRHAVRLSLFVDAGYLSALERESKTSPHLTEEYDQVVKHLQMLSGAGHDLQLHIHPHWEDCRYRDGSWEIDVQRYRLHDYDEVDQKEIVSRYLNQLTRVTSKPVFAYRAGGWCIQPFSAISNALKDHGVWLDSTAYFGGHSGDPIRWFDFRNAPTKPFWFFSDDPNRIDNDGSFVELPISSQKLSPLFFWKLAASKKLKLESLRSFGDGESMQANAGYYLTRLFSFSYSPASIDGLKAGELVSAYSQHRRRNPDGVFNVMGHPKSLTPYSIDALDKFLSRNSQLRSITFQDLQHLKPAA